MFSVQKKKPLQSCTTETTCSFVLRDKILSLEIIKREKNINFNYRYYFYKNLKFCFVGKGIFDELTEKELQKNMKNIENYQNKRQMKRALIQ